MLHLRVLRCTFSALRQEQWTVSCTLRLQWCVGAAPNTISPAQNTKLHRHMVHDASAERELSDDFPLQSPHQPHGEHTDATNDTTTDVVSHALLLLGAEGFLQLDQLKLPVLFKGPDLICADLMGGTVRLAFACPPM